MCNEIVPLTMLIYTFKRTFSTVGCCQQVNTETWKSRRLFLSTNGSLMKINKLFSIFFILLIFNFHFTVIEGKCGDSGRSILTSFSGVISDGSNSYVEKSQCEWLIQAPNNRSKIVLQFSSFETECTFDFLFVYDGDSYTSPLIASLSGDAIPELIVAKSGKMLVVLYSDSNYVLEGFQATYHIQNCTLDCSDHGTCVDNTCTCNSGYVGEWCQAQGCPSSCNTPNGECNVFTKVCECAEGFVGEDCNFQTASNDGGATFYLLSSSIKNEFTGRTGHAGAFHKDSNSLWIFGGFDLYSALDSIVYYNFTSNKWQRVSFDSDSMKPAARYGHTMTLFNDMLIVFGGSLINGTLVNDLWQFSIQSQQWTLLDEGVLSSAPLPTTDHSAVLVDNTTLYIFGGITPGSYAVRNMFKYDLAGQIGWEEVIPRGGNIHEVGVTGHSCVYHIHSKSLVVFGGLRKLSLRASYRTNDIYLFHLEKLYWQKLYLDGSSSVHKRAFHTANIIGNYMVVYGGNGFIDTSDTVTNVQVCYSNDILLFHFGCHQWVLWDDIIQDFSPNTDFTIDDGRFGHTASVRDDNTLLIVGGYRGTVLKDLIALKMPGSVATHPQNGTSQCFRHTSKSTCLDNPDCGWCSTNNSCTSYNDSTNCTSFEAATCTSVCSSLTSCESCLVWGQGLQDDQAGSRVNNRCGWCVQERSCQNVDDLLGRCSNARTETPTPWWGSTGVFLQSFDHCRTEDKPPGITRLIYRHPINESYPDEVSILSSTSSSFRLPIDVAEGIATGKAVFCGFLHPLGASGLNGGDVQVWMTSSSATSLLYFSTDDTVANKELVANTSGNVEIEAVRASGDALLPRLPADSKYYIFQEEEQEVKYIRVFSIMKLSWNGHIEMTDHLSIAIEDEFLQPFYSMVCEDYITCLACLSDTSCGWCSESNTCELRNDTGSVCVTQSDTLAYLISNFEYCETCNAHMSCVDCLSSALCEWLPDTLQCVRRGRFQSSMVNQDQCSTPCHQRTNCSFCITSSGECQWCENTRSCIPYGAHTSVYKYGQCRHWYNSVIECQDCTHFNTCSDCLTSFQCGWCGNQNNPTIGNCHSGDYTQPFSGTSCESLIAYDYNISASEPADWSYPICPEVEECRLGLDNCHTNASCIDTYESFDCECNRGYKGDGVLHCNKTCYYDCHYGHCSGSPDYDCICDVGWTGVNCSINCGCYNHSTCVNGTGLCDECQDWTMGEYCELCVPGSYGEATTQLGCHDCMCNGHGDPDKSYCDNTTGVCFCTGYTKGDNCEECIDGYYGDPRNGGRCYMKCFEKLVVTDLTSSALGSHEGDGAATPAQTYCTWILTVFDDLLNPSPLTSVPSITLCVEDISLMCGRDYVYVYDGLPSFITNSSSYSFLHLASFCEANTLEKQTCVQATSGVMTVMFQADTSSQSSGFNAIFTVNDCLSGCDGNKQCVNNTCICQDGFAGVNCDLEICPLNCSYSRGQGTCNEDLSLCVCIDGFGGEGCVESLTASFVTWSTLFDPSINTPSVDDLFPSGVMGHSIVVNGAGDSLILFGGYSFQDGSVNSLWKYNLTSFSWSKVGNNQLTTPSARHFHAAAYSSDILYISGGIADSGVLSDFWKYDIKQNIWTELQVSHNIVPPLAGHTLTVIDDKLFLIGGYSPDRGFLSNFLVYDIPTGEWEKRTSQGTPPTGIYGHSTVYHEGTAALYVFGGYRFSLDLVYASNKLFTLRPSLSSWSILPIESSNAPFSHVFHSALNMGDYMVVIGGATEEHNVSSTLMAYDYYCNVWFNLTQNNFTVGRSPLPAFSMAAVATSASTAYIYGGYSGVTSGALYRFNLPDDLCTIFNDKKDECIQVPGCASCVTNSSGEITSNCASSAKMNCSGSFNTLLTGDVTCEAHVVNRDCHYSESCSECLAVFPAYANAAQTCQWCMNCTETSCVKLNQQCPRVNQCKLSTVSERLVTSHADCINTICEASQCETCIENGCIWTRQYERTGEILRLLYREPVATWNCFRKSLEVQVPPTITFQSAPPDACPTRCHKHPDCRTCLESSGADGGWKQCTWSRWLNECLSPTYMLLRCASGDCGAIISKSPDLCPVPCHINTVCIDCITSPGCGWCAVGGENGVGVCMEGGLFSPTGGVCQGNTISLFSGDLPEYMSNYTNVSGTSWSFLECPPENECLNGHNNCGATQQCNDTQTSYLCTCSDGYEPASSSRCVPVCDPSCVHGECIRPNVCECEFGFVGGDCGVKCNCNGHSECSGSDDAGVNDCLLCQNNTMGSNCEYCKPLFVGDPRDHGACISCTEYCHKKTDVCLTEREYNSTVDARLTLTPEVVENTFTYGPLKNALCVNCTGYTSGRSCETCIDGYFKYNDDCTICKCNGHSASCNKETGLGCRCDNNTRTPECPDSMACIEQQCSKCNERYVGEPTNGHQCYLEMRVEQDYCFWSQTECPIKSESLPYGQSSFYAVQPKFKNLDIRMTIDVTYGKVDAYVTFNHSIFIIDVNKTTGMHTVSIDGNVQYESEGYRKKRDTNSNTYKYYEVTARGLNTFVTVETPKFIVVVFDVKNRLVITFPYMDHPLETGKFFVTLLGKISDYDNKTQGIMYFHQDQLHIDLFVFFSVFLACFFLVLAFCVIVWKAKSGLEQHRNQQERLIQMESMASRPFGKVMILLESGEDENEQVAMMREQQQPKSEDDPPPPLTRREEYKFKPGVMTSEMTDDGMATVGTLLITLPGKDLPTQACLVSALLTVKQRTTSFHIKEVHSLQNQTVPQKVIVEEEARYCNTRQPPRQVWQS
ncbi:multiple epidermal growth factor-like domains protein 8 [Anneissia japonica]|uniref:multiple epidermal growth factor-like domains protein 8 n=1 Tax=Anneissia japonica TaxID=1529436 RepID=UPI0014258CBC|nr:multiple epidermal growth factor-like domains protein 8 [Anneissia japonica]